MTRKITRELLEAHNACEDQVQMFAAEWPDGLVVCEEAIPRVIALGLDIEWAAYNLLTAPGLEAYERAEATALEAYEKAKATAWEAYKNED